MIDEDEGEQHAAAGEIRPMLSIKQVLALIPFSRATLYSEMEAGRFPAAHEIAPRRRSRDRTAKNCVVQG
jgi:predicted DNA-binding transcriptional regulator AlpA